MRQTQFRSVHMKAVRYQHNASVFIIRRRQPPNWLRAIRSTCFCITTWRGFGAAQFLFSELNFSAALGQKQTCAVQQLMSALPPKATLNAFMSATSIAPCQPSNLVFIKHLHGPHNSFDNEKR